MKIRSMAWKLETTMMRIRQDPRAALAAGLARIRSMMRAEMEADWAKIRAKREAAMAKSEAEWASLVADLTAELRATRADLARLRQLKAVSPGPEPMGDVIGQRAEDANRKPAP